MYMSYLWNNTKKRFKKKIKNAKSQGNNSYKNKKNRNRKNKTENKRKKRHFKNNTVKNKKNKKILFRVKQKIMNEIQDNLQKGGVITNISITTEANKNGDNFLIDKDALLEIINGHDFVQYSF